MLDGEACSLVTAARTSQPPRSSCRCYLCQSKEAIKAALGGVGVDAQTVAGKVVTVRIPAQVVGATAALDWVKSIELASAVSVR